MSFLSKFFFGKLITNSRATLGGSRGSKHIGINRQAVWLHNHNNKLRTRAPNCDCPPGWTWDEYVEGCSNGNGNNQPCGYNYPIYI